MTWLVAHMWIALAGAAVIALLLGWSLRGMALLGKLRRAEVDRDVARVELGEARDEIERLFAAQRKLLAGQGGAGAMETAQVSPQADPELERQLAETAAALRQARDELEALRTAPPVIAPAPEMAAVPSFDDAAAARTRELESQVTQLEGELNQARRALTEAEVAKAEAIAAAVPVAAEAAPAPVPEADPKLVWKASYLTQRVKALEEAVAAQPAVRTVTVEVPAAVVEPAPAAPAPAVDEAVEEELASLRWRNRYLEGRLAYFEGDADSVAEEIAAEETEEEAGETADETELAFEEAADTDGDDDVYPESGDDMDDEEDGDFEEDGEEFEDDADDDGDIEDELDDVSADADEPGEEADGDQDEPGSDEDFPSAAEAILGQLEEEDARADAGDLDVTVIPSRPLALEKPVEGAPDDLTLIGGIGPKIQEVLNSIGIFHYDQIAEWSDENIAWVDEYLNFNGRIKREGWVEQAAVLVGESVDP